MYNCVSKISPALSCVYELTPGKNPILYIFNTDNEAKTFWENGLLSDTIDKYWLYFPAHVPVFIPKWNENSKLVCHEQLWTCIAYYQGCVNETICTTTLLKDFIDRDAKNPYFERYELFCI